MNNLYVFAIGGSGERVMRSLIMLLASGVKLNANSVTPVFVDNDKNSAALTRCENLIKFYNNSLNSGRPGIVHYARNCRPVSDRRFSERRSMSRCCLISPVIQSVISSR